MFIFGKEKIDKVNSEIVFREYSYNINDKEIIKNVPELFIEGITKDNKKISIDFMATTDIEELNSFEMDEEIYFNDYLISNELFLGFDNNYNNFSIEDLDIFLTKIDKNYFNIRIEIPNYEIIIEYELKIEIEKKEMD